MSVPKSKLQQTKSIRRVPSQLNFHLVRGKSEYNEGRHENWKPLALHVDKRLDSSRYSTLFYATCKFINQVLMERQMS